MVGAPGGSLTTLCPFGVASLRESSTSELTTIGCKIKYVSQAPLVGVEPTTIGLEVRCSIH